MSGEQETADIETQDLKAQLAALEASNKARLAKELALKGQTLQGGEAQPPEATPGVSTQTNNMTLGAPETALGSATLAPSNEPLTFPPPPLPDEELIKRVGEIVSDPQIPTVTEVVEAEPEKGKDRVAVAAEFRRKADEAFAAGDDEALEQLWQENDGELPPRDQDEVDKYIWERRTDLRTSPEQVGLVNGFRIELVGWLASPLGADDQEIDNNIQYRIKGAGLSPTLEGSLLNELGYVRNIVDHYRGEADDIPDQDLDAEDPQDAEPQAPVVTQEEREALLAPASSQEKEPNQFRAHLIELAKQNNIDAIIDEMWGDGAAERTRVYLSDSELRDLVLRQLNIFIDTAADDRSNGDWKQAGLSDLIKESQDKVDKYIDERMRVRDGLATVDEVSGDIRLALASLDTTLNNLGESRGITADDVYRTLSDFLDQKELDNLTTFDGEDHTKDTELSNILSDVLERMVGKLDSKERSKILRHWGVSGLLGKLGIIPTTQGSEPQVPIPDGLAKWVAEEVITPGLLSDEQAEQDKPEDLLKLEGKSEEEKEKFIYDLLTRFMRDSISFRIFSDLNFDAGSFALNLDLFDASILDVDSFYNLPAEDQFAQVKNIVQVALNSLDDDDPIKKYIVSKDMLSVLELGYDRTKDPHKNSLSDIEHPITLYTAAVGSAEDLSTYEDEMDRSHQRGRIRDEEYQLIRDTIEYRRVNLTIRDYIPKLTAENTEAIEAVLRAAGGLPEHLKKKVEVAMDKKLDELLS